MIDSGHESSQKTSQIKGVIELNIDVRGFQIAALRATNGTRHRILCLHGWLDNANSFLPLLPLINDADIIAIDLPGHGKSDHQSGNSVYSLTEQAHNVLAIGEQLGWNTFTLIGHSLGGCIAPFASVAAANRIEQLIMIEAAGPRSESAEELPARLKKFHHDLSHQTKYNSRTFDNIEQAIESRLRANTMLPESARLIVERQVKLLLNETSGADETSGEDGASGEEKLQWRFDKSLRNASPSYFTEAQVQSVLAAITCPVLCVLGADGYLTDRVETNIRLEKISRCKTVTLAGHHHLHLDSPAPVANEINQFLATNK